LERVPALSSTPRGAATLQERCIIWTEKSPPKNLARKEITPLTTITIYKPDGTCFRGIDNPKSWSFDTKNPQILTSCAKPMLAKSMK
jgi:hypothetical protein